MHISHFLTRFFGALFADCFFVLDSLPAFLAAFLLVAFLDAFLLLAFLDDFFVVSLLVGFFADATIFILIVFFLFFNCTEILSKKLFFCLTKRKRKMC